MGPTNSGKSRFVVDQIYGPFCGKFNYIVLMCATFTHNKSYHRLGENNPRHMGISVWALSQKMTGITASFQENMAAIILFYTPLARTTKAIFDDYTGKLSPDEYKGLVSKLKKRKFSYLVFSLCHLYGVKLFE